MSDSVRISKKSTPRQPLAGSAVTTPGTPAEWCVGVVADAKDQLYTVTSGKLCAPASCAASCLLEPVKGDSVACLRVAPDEFWILAVLQREQTTEHVLRCQGDTRLLVQGGALTLDARETRIHGDGLNISVQHAKLATDSADVIGRQLRLIGGTVKVIGSVLSTVMDRVTHFSKHYLRTTDGVDRVSATHIECEASQLLRMQGEHTLVNATKLIKARGSQIHFG